MQPFWAIADFMRAMTRQMRFGELSRAPLQVLRVEWREDSLECDWMVRPPDVWDASIRRPERDRNVAQQALRDAMTLRDLIFSELPEVQSASLRAFQCAAPRESPELVIAGTVQRDPVPAAGIRSLAMRVKLCGLHFQLDDGRLEPLQGEVSR
jgi:hypothetical protein